MDDEVNVFPSPIPEQLVATFSAEGLPVHRNEAWEAVLGSGPDAWERLGAEDRDMALRFVSDALTGVMVTHQVFSAAVPGRDEPVPVLISFFPVYGEQSVHPILAVNAVGEVLAEPTTWTASQTQRNRMESLGRMSLGIAHDLNNLLGRIIGHVEVLNILAAKSLFGGEAETSLRVIEQAALDGSAVVNKIQQYVRREKRQHHEPLDFPTLVRDCVALTKPYWYNEARRQGIDIETRLDLRAVPPVMGSATELREVIVNLILNAVQAMPEGGVLTFSTRQSKAGVQVSIADTGTGMSESVKRRIFEPLFTTKGEHGTGMGLAITYGILKEHDAEISVKSELGEGTRFTLCFPPAEDAGVRTEAARPKDVEPVSILIVDDDPMLRSVLHRLLVLKGHSVVEASGGLEALNLAEEFEFDVVFTDHGMPEMNGRQFAHALHRRRPDLPIVLLTGDTEPGTTDEAIRLILSKPSPIEKLQEAIFQLVDKARQPSQLP